MLIILDQTNECADARLTLARDDSELRKMCTQGVDHIVRLRTSSNRARYNINTLRCSSLFTGTKRIVGRVTASQISSASDASFFCRFTYGLTYEAGISQTSCPRLIRTRAQ